MGSLEQVGDFASAACHEAGHAVMATVLGRRIDTVRIEDDAGGYCGMVEGPDIQDEVDAVDCSTGTIRRRNLINRELREVSIAISLAGLEAERRFHPEVDPQRSRADRDSARQKVIMMPGWGMVGERIIEAYLNLLMQRTNVILDLNWHRVEALADELLFACGEPLEGQHVEEIIPGAGGP